MSKDILIALAWLAVVALIAMAERMLRGSPA